MEDKAILYSEASPALTQSAVGERDNGSPTAKRINRESGSDEPNSTPPMPDTKTSADHDNQALVTTETTSRHNEIGKFYTPTIETHLRPSLAEAKFTIAQYDLKLAQQNHEIERLKRKLREQETPPALPELRTFWSSGTTDALYVPRANRRGDDMSPLRRTLTLPRPPLSGFVSETSRKRYYDEMLHATKSPKTGLTNDLASLMGRTQARPPTTRPSQSLSTQTRRQATQDLEQEVSVEPSLARGQQSLQAGDFSISPRQEVERESAHSQPASLQKTDSEPDVERDLNVDHHQHATALPFRAREPIVRPSQTEVNVPSQKRDHEATQDDDLDGSGLSRPHDDHRGNSDQLSSSKRNRTTYDLRARSQVSYK